MDILFVQDDGQKVPELQILMFVIMSHDAAHSDHEDQS
jgi:hypothetical protein